jgi:hypothetical protein
MELMMIEKDHISVLERNKNTNSKTMIGDGLQIDNKRFYFNEDRKKQSYSKL